LARSLVIARGHAAPLNVSYKSIKLSPLSPYRHRPYTKHNLVTSWSVLHWIDVLVRHYQVRVTYSYILVSAFYNPVKAFSDVFVLWGTWIVLTRYEYLRHNMMEAPCFLTYTFVTGLLWFLTLYHLCLLFALSFAWLSFADLNVINAIAKARSGFEVAFTALQFICTIWTALWAWGMTDGYPKNSDYTEVRSHTLEICIPEGSNTMPNIRHRK
jgi:hypothetical protein